MTYPVYICVFYFLVLMQTVVLPVFFNITSSYDLFVVLIIYMGFFRPLLESLPVVFFLGIVMDCFSGGAFGVYITTYTWLYAVVRIITQYFHVDSRILLPVAIVAGVTLENIIVLFTVVIGTSGRLTVSYAPVITAFHQAVWALLTGPLLFVIIKNIHTRCELWFKEKLDSDKENDDFIL